MDKDTKTYLILAGIVLLIIVTILLIKNPSIIGKIIGINNDPVIDEKTMKCIASKAVLYSQKGCSHCITQKEILGEYADLFNTIDCIENPEKCAEAGIKVTPTWVINGKKIEGVQTIKQLKELAGC